MENFYELYSSFDDFYNSFLRGNEVEFYYNDKQFYIVPIFNYEKAIGACIGESNSQTSVTCFTKDALYNATLGDVTFGQIFEKIHIIWNNF